MDLYRKVRLACAEGMSAARGGAAFRDFARQREEDVELFGSAGVSANGTDQAAEAGRVHRDHRRLAGEDRGSHRKQRHTAKRVFERLRDEHGFTGGYTIIKDYVREQERRGREMFVPLAHPPGHAQADFGEAVVVIGGVEQKAHFFAFDLPHSDACYVRAYPAATSEAWVDGHVHAFAFFGRVPVSVLYDNDRCLVARILPDGTRKRATLFSGFLSHYLIRDRYGRPGKGNDKGGVEGLVGYARRNFMVPIPRFATWDAFNAWLEEQCRKRQADILRGQYRDDRRAARAGSGRDGRSAAGAVRCLRPGHRAGQLAGAGALQDQRLLRAGRLRPPRCLDPRLCRRGGDRLRRRGHRPPSALLRPRGHGLRSGPLPSADREEDQRAGSGGAAGRMGPAARVRDPAPPDGGADDQGGAPRVCPGAAAAGDLRARRPACRREEGAAHWARSASMPSSTSCCARSRSGRRSSTSTSIPTCRAPMSRRPRRPATCA